MLEAMEDRTLMTVSGGLVANNDGPFTAIKNTSITIDVLANDVSGSGGALTITQFSASFSGTPTLNADNTVTFSPNLDALGSGGFYYEITDGADFATGYVGVNILPSASELYDTYRADVAVADQIYYDSLIPLLGNQVAAIDAKWLDASASADQLYAEYGAPRQAYETTHDSVVAAFQEAVLQARMASNDRETAALDAHEAAVLGPYANWQQALDAAGAQFLLTASAIQNTYHTIVSPLETALADAAAYAQANPDDPAAQAAWVQAQADLASAEPPAAALRAEDVTIALSVRQSAIDAATQTYKPTIDAADAAFDAELIAALMAYDAAELIAWNTAEGNENAAQTVFIAAEPAAWSAYQLALSSLNVLYQDAEGATITQFVSDRTAALAVWQGAETAAWQNYVTQLASLPTVQVPQVRLLQPAVDVAAPQPSGNVLLAQPREEPVLLAPVKEELFVLQPNPWQTDTVRESLNISGSTDSVFVRRAIASLDTPRFRLTRIPVLTPNEEAPAFASIQGDRAGPGPFLEQDFTADNAIPLVTAAQLARINLRANLIHLKQGLVDRIYNMVINNPPAGVQIVNADVAVMANQTADDLIRMVDLFLRTHPGARPELATRNGAADFVGAQDRFSHPWCADWAGAMSYWIQHVIAGQLGQHPANTYLDFAWGQSINNVLPSIPLPPLGLSRTLYNAVNVELQHNFIIIAPRGYVAPINRIQFSAPGNDAVDPVIIMFDPWRDLLPRAYRPTPWSEAARRTPTRVFVNPANRSNEYIFYHENRRDRRFNDRELRLGEFFTPAGQ